jgi:hypothetical protein
MRSKICFLLVSSFILHPSSFLRADGGALRLSEQQAGYRITVFTAPNPLRAGPVDVSVLVQDAATGEAVPEATVAVQATPWGRPGAAVRVPATSEAATNKLLRAALFELPEPGRWQIEVEVEGKGGLARVRFEAEAGEPLPRWLALWPWFTWPILIVMLFGIHQALGRRKRLGVSTRRLEGNEGENG